MHTALLVSFVLLGPVAIVTVVFLVVASIFTKRFSRFWRPCFYLCWLALVALMAVLPITFTPGGINDDFGNNSLMFLPLCIACLAVPFAAFPKPQRFIVILAVLVNIAAFFGYARWLFARHPFGWHG